MDIDKHTYIHTHTYKNSPNMMGDEPKMKKKKNKHTICIYVISSIKSVSSGSGTEQLMIDICSLLYCPYVCVCVCVKVIG